METSEEITKQVNSTDNLSILLYYLTPKIENHIENIIFAITIKHQRSNLQNTIYTAVKEMIINGIKANIKKIFFEENFLDITDAGDYKFGMGVIKKRTSDDWIKEYGQKAKEQNIKVQANFHYNENGLRVDVVNDVPLLSFEEKRIRKKLLEGDKYNDIVDYYKKHSDQTEGEGLGLVLNLLLLKSENMDPNLFRIGVINGKTISRIEFPFSNEFISFRGESPDINGELEILL
ncbi:MAG: histidine kinase [Leptospiraceae bacterium]|nr:histidine kinase [Leptospiraceae bacterium]MCK6381317.1 histidine kinase [Leptospiraceae bacterium]NUM40796.1 histidine kinase [Leptospiraceae bacterium]